MPTSYRLPPVTPGAPASQPIPLPAGSAAPTILVAPPPRDEDRETDDSYASITRSEKSVWMRKHDRFKDWARKVTGLGGIMTPESRMGRAAGVGSATWSDTASTRSHGGNSSHDARRDNETMTELEAPTRRGTAGRSERPTLPILEEGIAAGAGTDGEIRLPLARTATSTRRPLGVPGAGSTSTVSPQARTATKLDTGRPTPSRATPSRARQPSTGVFARQSGSKPPPPIVAPSGADVSDRATQSNVNNDLPSAAGHTLLRTGPTTLRHAPSPYLARPPSQVNRSSSTLHLDKPSPPAPGDLLSPYPQSGVTRAQRDAYISSALSLPLDMLAEVTAPSASKPSRDTSKLSGARLRSLLSQRSSYHAPIDQGPAGGTRRDPPQPPRYGTSTAKPLIQPLREGGTRANTAVQEVDRLKVPTVSRKRSIVEQLPAEMKQPSLISVSLSGLAASSRVLEKGTNGTTARQAAARPLPPLTRHPTIAPNSALGLSQDPLPTELSLKPPAVEAPVRGLGSQGPHRPQHTSSGRSRLTVPAEAALQETGRNLVSQDGQRSATRSNQATPPPEQIADQVIPDHYARGLGSPDSQLYPRSVRQDGAKSQVDLPMKSSLLTVASNATPSRTSSASTNGTIQAPVQSHGAAGAQRKSTAHTSLSPSTAETGRDVHDRSGPPIVPMPRTATTATEATHREQGPLPRSALSRNGLLMKPHDRLRREPSLSTIRFDPTTYALPASATSPEASEVMAFPPTKLHEPIVRTKTPIRSGIVSLEPKATNVNLTGQTVLFAPNSNVQLGGSPEQLSRDLDEKEHSHSMVRPLSAAIEDVQASAPPPSPAPSPYDSFRHQRPQRPPALQLPAHEYAPRTTPLTSPTTPAIIVSPAQAGNIHSPDAEHLSFEVPSGHRGRLMVSLAWFWDGPRSERRVRSDEPTSLATPQSPRPPPVPPKGPPVDPHRSLAGRLREHLLPRSTAREADEPRHSDRERQPSIGFGGARRYHRGWRLLDNQELDGESDHSSRRERERRHEQERQDDRDRREREREEEMDRQSRARSPTLASPPSAQPAYPFWNGQPLAQFGSAPNNMAPQYAQYAQPGFGYPQLAMPGGYFNPWNAGANGGPMAGTSKAKNGGASRSPPPDPAAGRRAPPSPPRPPSIDPPTDRGSPPAGPMPLPAINNYPNAMLGTNPMGVQSAPHVGDGWQNPWWNQQQPPGQQSQGRFSRFFGRQPRNERDGNETDTVARWRLGVNHNNPSTSAPALARTREFFGGLSWQRNDEDARRRERHFAESRGGDADMGDYYGRRTREELAPMPPMSSAVGLGLGISERMPERRVNFGRPRVYSYEAQRRELKEIRRREKAERRERRAQRNRERQRAEARRMNGLGTRAMGIRGITGVPRAETQNGRDQGFKTRKKSARLQAFREDRPQRSGFAGLSGFRNAAWGRESATVAPQPDLPRGRSPRAVRELVDVFRPRTARTTPTPYPVPAANRSRRDVRGAERGVRDGGYYTTGIGGGRAARSDDAGRLRTAKWSERAKAGRQR